MPVPPVNRPAANTGSNPVVSKPAPAGNATPAPAVPTPSGPVDTFEPSAPPPIQLDKAKAYADFLAQAKAAHANPDHLAFLDRGLKGSPYQANAPKTWELLGRRADGTSLQGAGSAGFAPFPSRGQLPGKFQPMPFLGPTLTNAAVAVGSEVNGQMQARWYGKGQLDNAQFWSSTKSINALGLISQLNAARPDLKVDDLLIREAGKPATAIPLPSLFQDITSYDAGAQRSNAGAGALGRMLGGPAREAFIRGNTGHDMEFRSTYGGGTLFNRPEVVTKTGERVLLSPAASGQEDSKNHVSAYDLTRMLAQAGWHGRLAQDARLPGAQSTGLGSWMRAMGEDSARYMDAAIKELGLSGSLKNVAIATKLGFGYWEGKYQLVYSGVVQFDDARTSPPRQRSMAFTLRGLDADAVKLDATMAAETTELLRRLVNGQL